MEQTRSCELPGWFGFGKVKSGKYPRKYDESIEQVEGRRINCGQT